MFEFNSLSFFWMLAPLPALAFVKNKSQETIVLLGMLVLGIFLAGTQAFEFGWASDKASAVQIIAISIAVVLSFATKERSNVGLFLTAPLLLSAALSRGLLQKFICVFICDLIIIAEHYRKEKNAIIARHELWGAVFCYTPAAFAFVAPRVPAEISTLILITILFRTIEWPVRSWAAKAIPGAGGNSGLFFGAPAVIFWFSSGAKGDPFWQVLILGLMAFFSLGRDYFLPLVLSGLLLLGRSDGLFSLGLALPFVAMATGMPLLSFFYMICAGALTLTSLSTGLTAEVEGALATLVGALVGRFFIRQQLFSKPSVQDLMALGGAVTFIVYTFSQNGLENLNLSPSAGLFVAVAFIVLSLGHFFWKTKKISLGLSSIPLAERLFEKFNTKPQNQELDSPIQIKASAGVTAITFESEFWAYIGFGLLGLLLIWSLL